MSTMRCREKAPSRSSAQPLGTIPFKSHSINVYGVFWFLSVLSGMPHLFRGPSSSSSSSSAPPYVCINRAPIYSMPLQCGGEGAFGSIPF